MPAIHEHSYDVVVVGAGGAGLRAAAQSAGRCRTAVVSKLHPTRAQTGAARGGIAAALGSTEPDSWQWHAFDTVAAGAGLTDADVAEAMCREAPESVRELEHLGVAFSRTRDGRIDQRHSIGHTRERGTAPLPRSCYAGAQIGLQVLHTLYAQCLARGVTFFDECYVLDLCFDADGAANGVVAYELAGGDLHVLAARAVVLASGGPGTVYATTATGYTSTGDGMALAWRAGLPLRDMEFVGFTPTGLAGHGVAVGEAARLAGGVLRNASGEAFMAHYAPGQADLAPAEIVCRSIHAELNAGRGVGGDSGHVLLDLTDVPAEELDRMPELVELIETYARRDPRNEPVPVRPSANYAIGGVPTGIDAAVSRGRGVAVPGLFAAGEVACPGVHGASRLGGNALAELAVFGRRAGEAAAGFAATVPPTRLAPQHQAALRMLERLHAGPPGYGAGIERAAVIRHELQQTMDRHAGPVRTGAALDQARVEIAALRTRYADVVVGDRSTRFNTDLVQAIELGYLLDVADVVVAAAQARTESRGVHVREDFPDRDDSRFRRHSLAHPEPDGSIRMDTEAVVTRAPQSERETR